MAPPGFGKSTLLADLTRSDDRPSAWLSLDSGDNDPIFLWSGILGALRGVRPDMASDLDSWMRTPGTDLVRGPIPRLLNELEAIDERVLFVVDDYHWITDPTCLRSIEFLVERDPANVDLVISTRIDPTLPLGRLRAGGELLELRAGDLSFTREETDTFLNDVLELGLSERSLSILQDRTEGWPAGLYLAYLSLRDSDEGEQLIKEFGGSSRHVADYLSEVVLERLDDTTRDFLLDTSILDRLSGPLCDEVTRRGGSAQILRQLEHSNSFLLPLDDRREWYRYHHLFSDLLKDDLVRRHADRIVGLHRRASAWYARAGDPGSAIRHSIDAGDLESATRLVCDHYLTTIEWGGFSTVARWLEAFPRPWIVEHAPLSIVEAWVMSLLDHPERAEVALANAASVGYEGPLPDGASSIEASLVLVRAGFPWGNVGRMLAAAHRAFELESNHEGSIWVVTVHVQLGWALCLSGEFAKARPFLERAVRLAPVTGQWLNLFGALCSLAWVCIETGEPEEAERWARQSVGVVEAHHLDQTAPSGWAYATLGAVLGSSGRSREADELLARGGAQLRSGGQPLLMIQSLLAHAVVRRALGANADARALVSEARALVDECTDAGILAQRLEELSRLISRDSLSPSHSIDLTQREVEVLRLLDKDLPERGIGRTLYLSFNTIHSHVRSIYRKLNASSRSEALLHARERGLL